MRRVLHGSAVFLFFVALAIAVTWPLAANLSTTLADLGDSALNTWILDWVGYALLHQPLRLYDAPIFHPDRYPLAYSENLVGIALVMMPFRLAGMPAAAVHNLALILGFATSAFAAYLLARLVTRNTAASIVGGIMYGFTSFKLDHLVHLQIVWSAWLPLLLAALLLYWRSPGRRHSLLLGVTFAMNGLSNVHWLLMGGFALVLTIPLLHAVEPRRGRAFWIGLVAPLALASLILVPFLVPYQVASKLYRMRRFPGELRLSSATLYDWLRATPLNFLYGKPDPRVIHLERRLFPGALPILLTAAAFALARRKDAATGRTAPETARPRRLLDVLDVSSFLLVAACLASLAAGHAGVGGALRKLAANPSSPMMSFAIPLTVAIALTLTRVFIAVPFDGRPLGAIFRASRFSTESLAAAAWIVIGFIASCGMNLFLVPFLFRVIHPFRAMRTPSRWAVLVYVGLAVWAAIGASALMERTRRRTLLAAMLIVVAIVEIVPNRLAWAKVPQVSAVYSWLRDETPGIALEIPLSGGGEQALYLLASTIHHQPILNGASGFEPPTHDRLRKMWEAGQLDDTFLDHVRQAGASILIVHRPLLGDRQELVDRWLASAVARGRVRFERAFGGDEVYWLEEVRW